MPACASLVCGVIASLWVATRRTWVTPDAFDVPLCQTGTHSTMPSPLDARPERDYRGLVGPMTPPTGRRWVPSRLLGR